MAVGRDDTPIEGEEMPPYALYELYGDGSLSEVRWFFDTIQEARAHRQTLDKGYALLKYRKRLPNDWPTVDY